MQVVTRFAPSPTGHLHLGSAYSAYIAWKAARSVGGRFLLRIEDIDTQRCRPDYATAIIEDLHWLGLDWDGPIRRQTEHLPDYRAALDSLSQRGLLYPCFCSRADIAAAGSAAHGPDGPIYPGTCLQLSAVERQRRMRFEPYALRLNTKAALAQVNGPLSFQEHGQTRHCDPARFGDVVLNRRDTQGSYHFCVTHADAQQGVTLVTRGDELLDATDIHRLIQALMGWPTPAYAHHPLLRDQYGQRLAKRSDSTSIRTLRASGATATQVRAMASIPDPL